MPNSKNTIATLADVLLLVEASALPPYQRRDMRSAINRIAEMAGVVPAMAEATAPALRQMLMRVQPAAHGVTQKTFSNLLSGFRAALRLAEVIEPRGDGLAMKDPAWAPLLKAIAEDKRLSCGLAAFVNYSAWRQITPDQVADGIVQQFHVWFEQRTLYPDPRRWCGARHVYGTKLRSGSRAGPRTDLR